MVIEHIDEFLQRFEEIGKCPTRMTKFQVPCYKEVMTKSPDNRRVCFRHRNRYVKLEWVRARSWARKRGTPISDNAEIRRDTSPEVDGVSLYK